MTATATRPINILLQTTIRYDEDDWHVGRFSMLRDYIAGLTGADGEPLARVTARDRHPGPSGQDPVLSSIDSSDQDQVWLFGVDVGADTGINGPECRALTRFRERGGAIVASRDHQDVGASLCTLGGIGKAHFFHSIHPDPDPAHRMRDDPYTTYIDFPNFHSGDNGDVQRVRAVEPVHPVFAAGGMVETLPAHPHEGDVGKPADDDSARVVATGTSAVTGRPFNVAVAFESTHGNGRGWAVSTFHQFADFNWNPRAGCPSFVTEKPSEVLARDPALLADTKRYVRNLVAWLGRRPG